MTPRRALLAVFLGAGGFACSLATPAHSKLLVPAVVLWLLAFVTVGLSWQVLLALAVGLGVGAVISSAVGNEAVARRILSAAIGVALVAGVLFLVGSAADWKPRPRDPHRRERRQMRRLSRHRQLKEARRTLTVGAGRTASAAADLWRFAWEHRPRPALAVALSIALVLTTFTLIAGASAVALVATALAWLAVGHIVGVPARSVAAFAAGGIGVVALASAVDAPGVADKAAQVAVVVGFGAVGLAILHLAVSVASRWHPRRGARTDVAGASER